jgi:hypothetical protein
MCSFFVCCSSLFLKHFSFNNSDFACSFDQRVSSRCRLFRLTNHVLVQLYLSDRLERKSHNRGWALPLQLCVYKVIVVLRTLIEYKIFNLCFVTNVFLAELCARALRAPVFLGSSTRKTGLWLHPCAHRSFASPFFILYKENPQNHSCSVWFLPLWLLRGMPTPALNTESIKLLFVSCAYVGDRENSAISLNWCSFLNCSSFLRYVTAKPAPSFGDVLCLWVLYKKNRCIDTF